MSDFRASVKITFHIFGITREFDGWINWWPDGEVSEVDDRVIEFFRTTYRAGYASYRLNLATSDLDRATEEQDAIDRAEYKRLAAIYGPEAERNDEAAEGSE